jgi:hypothetical protein
MPTRTASRKTSRQVQRVRSARKSVKATSRDLARQAGSTAEATKTLVASGLRNEVARRVSTGGDQVATFARALRSAGDQLWQEGQGGSADLILQAADRLDDLQVYLQNKDPETLLSDVEDLARRNPWMLGLAGAFVGLAVSRFVKASTPASASR